MKKITALLFAAGITAGSLTAQSNINTHLWSDTTFVNEFLGSYGFLAGAEPQISDEEKEALRNLIDLIKASPKAAIQALEPQITQSSSAAFDFILGNLYFQDGNLSKAEQYYGNAVVKHPDFRRAYKNLGLVQVQQGNFDKAIKTISKAMELGEVDGRSYGLLGYGYLTQERYYPAEAAYRQAILMQPEVTDWKVGLARCLLETARYADAIALFDTLLLDEPNNADYWMLQGNAYLGKGESLAAAKNLEVVRRMGAADLSTLTLLGDIYMNNNSPDLALEAYLAATKVASDHESKALLRAADLLTRSGNYEQSKTIILRIREQLELPEADDLTLLTLEAKIARAEGNDEAAVELLNQIVERDALNGDALIELANFYADQNEMAKAINRFQQAEKIEAFEREALIAHAQARVRNGDYKEALPLLRRALQIKPDSNLEDYAQRVEKAARS
ncbi:tetratricopeptide repeat protein [Coraliomargarita sp. SDUM461004]|uniref:Tetratricopeptide repeat protein n=1 Tax=Thalassobacterium sedimentorum TaxID=3041258 RepID=A0ABU1AHP7_9BACT|nr:tetratricopeptide repeat protein [Coraliomargarita sp. SDUM461004]MDQ8194296.1 tetratricopeptide repeat protein [Coraliomargarita sp. SDUM461004]